MSDYRSPFNNNRYSGYGSSGGQNNHSWNPQTDWGHPQPQRTQRSRKRISDGATVASWLVNIALCGAVPPLGIASSIATLMGHNFVGKFIDNFLGGQKSAPFAANRVNLNNGAQQSAGYAQQGQYARQAQKAPTQAPGAAMKANKDKNAAATAMTVFGWILVAFAVITTLGSINTIGIWGFLALIAVALGGVGMLFSARKMKKKQAKFRECLTVTGDQGIVRVGKLAKILGIKDTEIFDFLSDMIELGMFGERAYIDHDRGLLVIKPEEMRDVYRAEDEARADQARRDAQANESDHQRYIRQIADLNDRIADEAMSAKIARMQQLTDQIFSEVERHPEKSQKISRFMSYYLPTTLKLLDNYARIEAQGVTGSNMAQAKRDIERIADTLVEGYEKQLDTLYSDDAMDIAGDVTVIENMMRRDGLTGSGDFRTQDAAFRAVVADSRPVQTQPAAQPQPAVQTSAGTQVPSLQNDGTPYVSPFGAASPLNRGGAAVQTASEQKKE